MTEEHLNIHHLGVAVADLDQALRFYTTTLGLAQVSPIVTDPIQKVRVCFLENKQQKNFSIELIHPQDATSPVNGYLARGIGTHHICYEVKDLDRTLESWRAKGCLMVGAPVPATAFAGRRIAWLFTPTKHLIELLEAAPESR